MHTKDETPGLLGTSTKRHGEISQELERCVL